MKNYKPIICFIALASLSLIVSVCYAAFLESDYGSGTYQVVVPPTPLPPIIPPPNSEGRDIRVFIRQLTVGEPRYYQGFAVYPLYHPEGSRSRHYIGMDAVLRRGELELRERNDGVVSEILASSSSDRFVFLMAGEILMGGKQNRILRSDVLLSPGCRDIVLSAYCVEKGRWRETHGTGFLSEGYLSSSGVRATAAEGGSQEEIWGEVDQALRLQGVRSETSDHALVYQSSEYRERADEYKRRCRPVLRRDPVGLVIVRGGHIAGAEIFVDSNLLEQYWGKIVDSYLSDWPGIREPDSRYWPPAPDRERVRRFLSRVESARFVSQPGPGVGLNYRIQGPVFGSSLVYGREPVHTTLHEGVRALDIEKRRIEE